MGDWFLPLLHNDQSGFSNPQNPGPVKYSYDDSVNI